jgi:hypothetical protein
VVACLIWIKRRHHPSHSALIEHFAHLIVLPPQSLDSLLDALTVDGRYTRR